MKRLMGESPQDLSPSNVFEDGRIWDKTTCLFLAERKHQIVLVWRGAIRGGT